MPVNGDKRITELPAAATLNLDDLLAVVHDGVTSRVTLRDLIKELQIDIPQPRIRIRRDMDKTNFGHDEVCAFWEGGDNRFMKYNPEFWVYRYKKAELRSYYNKKENKRVKEWMKKRFVHPSHQHGSKYIHFDPEENGSGKGANHYDGEFRVSLGGTKGLIPGRNTEWAVNTSPLVDTNLDLEPWKWYRIPSMNDPDTGTRFSGIAPDIFPITEQPTPRGTGSSKSRFIVFKVRIAIDNPDGDINTPKLFGPFSETFVLYPHKFGKEFTGFKYFLGSEAAPQIRKST